MLDSLIGRGDAGQVLTDCQKLLVRFVTKAAGRYFFIRLVWLATHCHLPES